MFLPVTLQLLAPEAEALAPCRDAPRTLGSVLLCDLREDPLGSWARARTEWDASPWCPLVAISREPFTEPHMQCLIPRACSVAVVRVDCGALTVAQIRRAVRSRRSISRTTFAAYVALRCEPVLERLVTLCLSDGQFIAGPAGARLRRRLKQIGPYTQREWLNLFALSEALERCTRNETASQERVAMDLGMAPRTLSVWVRDYLESNWQTAVRLGAWEPIVERVLRVAGYVAAEAGQAISGPKRRVSGPQLRW